MKLKFVVAMRLWYCSVRKLVAPCFNNRFKHVVFRRCCGSSDGLWSPVVKLCIKRSFRWSAAGVVVRRPTYITVSLNKDWLIGSSELLVTLQIELKEIIQEEVTVVFS